MRVKKLAVIPASVIVAIVAGGTAVAASNEHPIHHTIAAVQPDTRPQAKVVPVPVPVTHGKAAKAKHHKVRLHGGVPNVRHIVHPIRSSAIVHPFRHF